MAIIVQDCATEEFLKTILLIDDSKFQRVANERLLTKAGYQVFTAGDGEAGLALACSSNFDLIVLDMLLPKISGPEVLKALQKNPKTRSVPVLVLSSLAQKNEERLKRDGATAYFEKSRLDLSNVGDPLLKIVQSILASDPWGREVNGRNHVELD